MWHDEVKIFSLDKEPSMLKLEVYDKERFKWSDDFVGIGQFLLEETGLQVIPIYNKSERAGSVFIEILKWND